MWLILIGKDMEKIYKKFNMDEYNGFSNEVIFSNFRKKSKTFA